MKEWMIIRNVTREIITTADTLHDAIVARFDLLISGEKDTDIVRNPDFAR